MGKTNNRGISAAAGAAIDENYTATLEAQTLTDAENVVYDASLGVNAQVLLTDNRIFDAPTNAIPGSSGKLVIVQDDTGSRLATWAAEWKFAGGTGLVLSTAADAVDILHWYTPDGEVFYVLGSQKALASD